MRASKARIKERHVRHVKKGRHVRSKGTKARKARDHVKQADT